VPKASSTNHYTRLVAENIASGNDVLLRNIYLDNDETWTEITLSPAPADIYLIRRRNDSNGHLFLATSNGVWRSTNEGSSFSRIGLSDVDVKSIAVAPSDVVFAGTSTTLYKSTDNGSTWTNVGDMDVSLTQGR
jgi:photosystem II stability/assembly factor-like uncharacterized protein